MWDNHNIIQTNVMKKALKFKTNIKCMGCVATVTPVLNETVGEGNWAVDLQSPERQLTVEAEKIEPAEVIAALGKVGFKAEAS